MVPEWCEFSSLRVSRPYSGPALGPASYEVPLVAGIAPPLSSLPQRSHVSCSNSRCDLCRTSMLTDLFLEKEDTLFHHGKRCARANQVMMDSCFELVGPHQCHVCLAALRPYPRQCTARIGHILQGVNLRNLNLWITNYIHVYSLGHALEWRHTRHNEEG